MKMVEFQSNMLSMGVKFWRCDGKFNAAYIIFEDGRVGDGIMDNQLDNV
jgi:hypothetical protein